MSRRPCSKVESFSTSNSQDDAGLWMTTTFAKGMWVTMCPSTNKVSRMYMGLKLHHCKGGILDLKHGADRINQVLVQHVYKAFQLCLNNINQKCFLANCKFCFCFFILMPSNRLPSSISWFGSLNI